MINKLKSFSNIQWFRMAIGLFFVSAGIGEKRWGIIMIGTLVFVQGFMDWGCGFSKNSCGTPNTKIPNEVKFDSEKSIKKINK